MVYFIILDIIESYKILKSLFSFLVGYILEEEACVLMLVFYFCHGNLFRKLIPGIPKIYSTYSAGVRIYYMDS